MTDYVANRLVSVIIIFFNSEKYLDEAIQSVIAQTYSNWNLFLVDDGSSDESTAIAKNYTKKHTEKIFYLEHDNHFNKGMSASRNLGVKYVKSEWIAFLDSDDVWLPHKLSQQMKIAQQHPNVELIYGNTYIWHSWNEKLKNISKDYISSRHFKTNTIVYPPDLLFKNRPFGKFTQPGQSEILIKRELINRIGGFVDVFKDMNEDLVFYLKIYMHGITYASDNVWFKYRIHRESCVQQVIRKGEFTSLNLKALIWFENYLKDSCISNNKINKLLKQHIHYLKLRLFLESTRILNPNLNLSASLPGKLIKKLFYK